MRVRFACGSRETIGLKSVRTIFIAGNWKMNPTTAQAAVELAEQIKAGVSLSFPIHVALCPPSLFLTEVDRALDGSPIGLGAQNLHHEPKGAFTGELSAPMLIDVGCTHVIIGHSERRQFFGETDAGVNVKIQAALKSALLPIVCVGETRQERDSGQTETVVRTQLEGGLADLTPDQISRITLAYEPVWAIGTGLTATPQQAQDVHAFIRSWLAARFGEAISQRVVIQYGGSVKADNALTLLTQPDIDGALVGGASLIHADFQAILDAGAKAQSQKAS